MMMNMFVEISMTYILDTAARKITILKKVIAASNSNICKNLPNHFPNDAVHCFLGLFR
jgi:hypothetical protein